MNFRILFLPLLVFLFSSPVHGQMVQNIKLSTVSFEKPIQALYFKNNGKTEKFAVPKGSLSLPISYSGTRGIIFFAAEDDLANGAPEYARVVLPENSAHTLLKFGHAPVDQEEDENEAQPEEDSLDQKQADNVPTPMVSAYAFDPKDHKAGSYRIFNNTKETIDLKLGEETEAVEPGEKAMLQSSEWSDETKTLDFSASTTKEDGKVTKLYSSMWGHRPERRYMVFIETSSDRFRPVGIFVCYDVP